jgi:hypothetical protein
MSEIPNLNLLVETDVGIAVCHEWDGKYIIHSELYQEPTPETLKEAKRISNAIDKAFITKGIPTIYTWAETSEQERYNKFLGYQPTGRTVNNSFVDQNYPRAVLEYKKELM